jgi:1-phosphofructokinase
MIYTITLNPSVDYYMESNKVKLGALTRTTGCYIAPAGKGINVSVMLNTLGVKSTILGFFGGFTGDYLLEQLRRYLHIHLKPTKIQGQSRINVKLIHDQETEINALGPEVSGSELNNLLNQLNTLSSKDLVVISGSTTANDKTGLIEQIVKYLIQRKIDFVLDVSGPELKKLIKYEPKIIKPNLPEFQYLADTDSDDPKKLAGLAKKVADITKHTVLLSLGEKGAVLIHEGKGYVVEAPEVVVKHTIGAGDALLAGYMYKFDKTSDPKLALAFATALAVKKVEGNDITQIEEIEQLALTIKVKAIS